MTHALKSCLKISAGAFLGLGTLGFSTSASACGGSLSTQPAAYQTGSPSGLLHQASEDNPGNHAIVGMWSVKFASSSGYSDFGYVQWHSDGTEFMNSGGRAPSTQNFCMGVWKQVAPSRYHLVHLAISYDTAGNHNANVVIKEDVTLNASGNGYSGPFTIDVYNPDTNAVLQHVAGRVTGTRILPN